MKAKILLVEDEESVRGSVARMLRDRGHEVDECENGEEGLERLRGNIGAYALVICDLSMPLLNGVEMLKQAGDALGAARVLLLSAYLGEAPAEVAGRPLRTLSKPAPLNQLGAAVEQMLAA
jgi:DNA-binding NtrC family response regulator